VRVAHFDCFSGISGDMTLAALLDAGLHQIQHAAEDVAAGDAAHRALHALSREGDQSHADQVAQDRTARHARRVAHRGQAHLQQRRYHAAPVACLDGVDDGHAHVDRGASELHCANRAETRHHHRRDVDHLADVGAILVRRRRHVHQAYQAQHDADVRGEAELKYPS
jgi:uncharacterized protein (DUF111 family)